MKKISKEPFIVKSNEICGRNNSLVEARILYSILLETFKMEKLEEKNYFLSAKTYSEVSDISEKQAYEDLKAFVKNFPKFVENLEENGNKRIYFPFSFIEFNEKTNEFIIKFNPDFINLLNGKREFGNFAKLSPINVRQESCYGVNLYEFLKKDLYKKEVIYEVDFLREFFNLEDKYKNFKDFRVYFLEKNIKEINEGKFDIKVEWRIEEKIGKKIKNLRFFIRNR